MTIHFGAVTAGSVLPIMFCAYNAAGASVTLTGLAASDIEIFKGTSMTQRSSDNGYTLLDTDGIDLDGITGLHGFSVDLSDNSDAGFYAAGSFYNVVVSTVTIDSQTVTLLAATFRIGPVDANVTQNAGTAITSASGRQEVNTTHIAGSAVSTSTAQLGVNAVQAGGTAWGSGAITAGAIATDAITAAKIAADAGTEIGTAVWAAATRSLTILDEDSTTLDLDATIRNAVGLASANLDTVLLGIDNATDDIPDLLDGVLLVELQAALLSTTSVATDLTGYADDALIGRAITFLDGDCAGQARTITGYTEADGVVGFAALTTTPADGDRAKVT